MDVLRYYNFFYEPETVTASYNQDEIDNFLSTIQNEKSKKKTHYDLKIVKRFLYGKEESRDIEDIPPADLSPILCHFFMSLKNHYNNDYEPSTIRSIFSSIERHLKTKSTVNP